MAKKDKKSKDAKKARAAEKQKKQTSKAESKNKKLAKKLGEDDDDQDIDAILEQYNREQEELVEVKVEICDKPPSKRLNPSMIASPTSGKRELILFGGESTENGVSHFYNELYTYTIDNDTWRKYTSKNSPLPRSSHAMCSHPSGIALMFGGEFSSPKQSTFYHYGDTWILDADSKEWSKIDVKKGPSARSGHRLAVWKNYIIMHGGFRDLGTMTTYLNDVWLFDITDYKWTQVEFPPTHTIPDARSGHSLLPCADGAIIYGGYTKVKARKGLQKGKVLNDCWILKMKSEPNAIRFERKRKQGFVPSPRVGCSLVYHKNRGIMFGGVYDFEESEEQLESEFYNSLYCYQVESNRWYNLSLKPQRKRKEQVKEKTRDEDLEDILNSILAKANLNDEEEEEFKKEGSVQEEQDDDEKETVEYPVMNQLPHARFNATTCVVDDTLYIYGGIFERGEQEFNLDSMYAIDLGKLDGVKVLWEDLSELEKSEVNSEDEEDDEDDEDDEDEEEGEDAKLEDEDEDIEEEEEEEAEEVEEEFPDPRPWLPHPKPFETLRAFYVRSGAQFLEWAISNNKFNRGKDLKKAAFDLCEDRFWERREAVSVSEDNMEELGGVAEIIERDASKVTKRR
ncbi:uncharacterized protein SPAPADRAFT_139179 [Spathaspora passalidarum NRRL Y-27907]|uniref:DUF4110 domain-containing protein n=1 Tax=Spathaspora passalidarum (strain NRRL Y-27907 / 11-Y1) TaxID=619300 RepID=G3ANX3_SPAPN|nr:uncharacterized protein SPAPADRAFT_139179 [Spathaspora passalidarum NRRL Y-27907]EGW32598.1 hypothetical protein SPAPADRAFT_139179 [Spathaspora passalidarum NRRL Y-27907]